MFFLKDLNKLMAKKKEEHNELVESKETIGKLQEIVKTIEKEKEDMSAQVGTLA